MSDDIVTRLREIPAVIQALGYEWVNDLDSALLVVEAADEIERLRLILTHICDVWGSDLLSIIEEMNRFKKEIK